MKYGPGKWTSLEGVLNRIWRMLTEAAHRSDVPFHHPVLGTAVEKGCSLRTVILRQVGVSDRILVCHSDARSAKVREMLSSPQVSWLFYDPKQRIQLRISGQASLHTDDAFADRQWANTGLTSRLNYCATNPPGTRLDKPGSGLPDFLLNKIPTLMESQGGRRNFMAIKVEIAAIDWLMLKVTGNRRARFQWDKGKLHATWLVP